MFAECELVHGLGFPVDTVGRYSACAEWLQSARVLKFTEVRYASLGVEMVCLMNYLFGLFPQPSFLGWG